MAEKVRVGVIGHGHFGGFHAKQYEAHPEAELVAIADPRPAAAETIHVTYGSRHVANYADLIGRVDAVSIAAPTAMHFDIARQMIEAGIHVLVEKPLAETAAEARQLTALAESAGVVLNVGHIERFSAAYRQLKAEASGSARLYELRRHGPWRGRILDVDVVLDLMIHDIDLALDLTRSKPTEVSASGIEVKGYGLDAVQARVVFENGATAHISASRVAPAMARTISVNEPDRTLWVDLASGKIGVYSAGTEAVEETEIAHHDSLRAEIDAFLGAVRGESAGGVSGTDAAAALDLAEAIRAAAHRGLVPR